MDREDRLLADHSLSGSRRNNVVAVPNVFADSDREAPQVKNTPDGRFVVLDFETTGLSPHGGARVIEVSPREVVDGRTGEEYLTFVDPGQEVPSVITQITGITTAMLQGAPKPAMVMRDLAAFIGSSAVVGQHVGFDRKFLEQEAAPFLGGRGGDRKRTRL